MVLLVNNLLKTKKSTRNCLNFHEVCRICINQFNLNKFSLCQLLEQCSKWKTYFDFQCFIVQIYAQTNDIKRGKERERESLL